MSFDSGMGSSVQEQVQLKGDLQLALAEEQFFLVYQPIIDLATLEIVGAEALLRWQHPTRGVVAPLEFIPSLESTGLIVEVGRWVLKEACRQAAIWERQDLKLTMNCNISARQLESDALVQDLQSALESSRLGPSSLVIEITESTVMKDVTGTIRRLNAFKALGVGVAIDDFGTGYSSLSYVHRFPVDVLKIDRSFVSVIDDTSSASMLVQVIVQLGSELSLDVVAEGIETPGQYEKLLEMSCKTRPGLPLREAARPRSLRDLRPRRRGEDGAGGRTPGDHHTGTVTRARRSTSPLTNPSGSGQGKPGSATCRLTIPCIATHIAVLSATTSVLVDWPLATHAATASTSRAKLSAPNSSTGRPSGSRVTGLQYSLLPSRSSEKSTR